MRNSVRSMLIGFIVAAAACRLDVPLRAQSNAAAVGGHWKGTVQVQTMQVGFDVDIVKTAAGDLAGTIGLPSQRITGLPLQKIALDGNAITFYARDDQPFHGMLSADGTIAGDMSIEGLTAPFTMTRSGDAAIDAPPRSGGIDKAVAGTWTGALEADGRKLRLAIAVERQADGTMVAEMTDIDEGGLRSPLKLTQDGSTLTIESVAIPAAISGALNADATELIGTFKQGSATLPLTLRRAAGKEK